MKTARDALARDGVALVRELVDPGWVERLRAAVPALLPDAGVKPAFHNVANVHRRSPDVRAFIEAAPVAAIAGALLDAAAITLYADVLLVKEARASAPTPWHQDLPFWPFRGRALTAWIALDRTDDINGALRYVAGSHRWGRWFRPASVPAQPLPEGQAEEMPIDPADGGTVIGFAMEPGDVLFHDPLVIHGAGGNLSGAARRALSLRLVADGSRYIGRALLPSPPSALSPGDPIELDPAYPIVWRAG